jgi:hypothetical protein
MMQTALVLTHGSAIKMFGKHHRIRQMQIFNTRKKRVLEGMRLTPEQESASMIIRRK